jgi:hypothetical protein
MAMAAAPPKRTWPLSLHTADQSEEELLLSQELLEELRISRGCFVEIRAVRAAEAPGGNAAPPGAAGEGNAGGLAGSALTGTAGGGGGGRAAEWPDGLGNLVLQIGTAAPPKGSHSVSVLAAAASLFSLSSRELVELTVVPPAGAALEWVEMVFRDQYLSRGDIWYWMQQLTDE